MNKAKLLSQAQKQMGDVKAAHIIAGVFGFLHADGSADFPRKSVIYATDDRLIIYSKTPVNYNVAEIQYDSITSVQLHKHVFRHSIDLLQTSAGRAVIRKVAPEDSPEKFVAFIKEKIEKA